jgi:catechol 2,3-dioxygenase-like lactoylglutathione lyase family enzyme
MSTQKRSEHATRLPSAERLEAKLEVVIVPVSDVERALRFYRGLGWRLDGDFQFSDEFRVVQMTPPASPCSIIFGNGVTTSAPGSLRGLMLVVRDIEAARADLGRRGVEVSEVFHSLHAGEKGRVPGPDPEGRSYFTFASFNDPDGNVWLLQEITTRLPGRGGLISDATTLAELLRETEQHHGEYERVAPKHHWSEWYAAYVVARENGSTAAEAAKEAGRHMERVRERAQG